ncbi:hypothetical protein OOJ91_08880 [Micromonospora lupini]|uniref:hypothetical protein n=1 Tax=Micromonospora lupini TaxID=285679 RepID=UPI00224CBCDE|nr:hypothetical protein [Micromonospora lupini]MCX5065996.1 hypothetical protein [Micromonospora lupini]
MTSPAPAAYTFLPWVQGGVSRSIAAADEPAATLPARVTLPVSLHLDPAGDVPVSVRLYGPGDVTGLTAAQIVRRDPAPGTTRFEPGYLPQVQFARADLPWLFTPAAPDTTRTRLRPWLVLVAVRRGAAARLRPGNPLPVLELDNPAAELPDLAQSWAWAHAQITGLAPGVRPADALATDPGRAGSRLVCARKLEAGTAYLACLVPAFAVGVQAGLGLPVPDEAKLDPAWGATPTGPLRLPVYDSWEFETGREGSFETLVRRLHPAPFDATTSRPPDLDLGAAGSGLPAAGVIGVQSALRAPGPDDPPAWPDTARMPFQTALERLLGTTAPDTLAPPTYGQVQAGVGGLPPAGAEPAWLRELNLDPRLRVAAAAGTRVVKDRQERLMARAWEQAGAAAEANAVLRGSQLARELGGVVMDRHLTPLSPPQLVTMTRAAHTRIALGGGTVADALQASRIPAAAASGAMRRLASPEGALARRAAQTRPVDMLAAIDQVATRPPPAPPTGMVIVSPVALQAAVAVPAAVDTRPAISADVLRAQLLERLAPEKTVLARAMARVAAPADTWTRPDPLAPAAIAPRFPEPMFDGLQRVAPWLFLPGVEDVEADGVALLETTPKVIEAYLAGLNHEFSRELLWREFPGVLTGTAFRQFWDVSGRPGDAEALADIPPIARWAGTPLGRHLRGGSGQLVLLVRGELLRRYPTTTIYAAQATGAGALDATTRLQPMFRAALPPDIVLVGFGLSEEAALAAPGWYFVFEQYPGEPRFGFDEVAGPGVPATPDALAWAHVPVTASGHADVSKPLLSASAGLQAQWGKNAATTAFVTFQQPFRIAMHASRLIARRTT